MPRAISFLFQDLDALRSTSRTGAGGVATLLTVRSAAVFLFRLSQLAGRSVPFLGSVLKQLNHLLTGADLAWQADIGPGLVLHHPTGVVIGPHVSIGPGCVVQQGVTLGGGAGDEGGRSDSPVLGSRVQLGPGSRVLGPVRVGDDSLVAANAVVVRDVSAESVARGVPARSYPRPQQ
jgi:serine O-acetyltransferase